MGKVKYSEGMKLQTVKYVLVGEKVATKVSKELGIDTNTVCRWVREYLEVNQMSSYEAEQQIKRQSAEKMAAKIIEGSMSVPGCPYDNSCAESFFATLKKELIFRKKYAMIKK